MANTSNRPPQNCQKHEIRYLSFLINKQLRRKDIRTEGEVDTLKNSKAFYQEF